MPRIHLIRGVYTRENTLCKNLGVKKERGCLLEGDIFLGTYGMQVTKRTSYMREQSAPGASSNILSAWEFMLAQMFNYCWH